MNRNVNPWMAGIVVASAVAIALPAQAQTPEPPEPQVPEAASAGIAIALIDSSRVVAESDVGRELAARADAAAGEWQGRLATAQSELQALVQRRANGVLTLSSAALADLDAQIEERTIAGRRLEEDARRAMAGVTATLMQELNDAIGPSLQQFARERGFQLVLDAGAAAESGVLYWADEIDVTTDFIARINREPVAWRRVDGADGLAIGSARVQDSAGLAKAALGAAPRVRR